MCSRRGIARQSRTSGVDDVPVIFHEDPDGLTFGRKLWLSLPVPFLVGFLAGSILRRRRRT
jgi:hypothetical protein